MKATPITTTGNSGSVGGMTAVNVDGHTYYRAKRAKLPKGAKMTYGQRRAQAQLATLASAYHPLEELLKVSLLTTSPMQRAYGLFLRYNMGDQQALLPKHEADRGTQLLGNYTVSRGTGELAPVEFRTAGGMHLSDIRLGDFELTAESTLAQLTQAVISQGRGIREGDLLTFVACRQGDTFTGDRSKITMSQATLPLQSYAGGLGAVPVRQLLMGLDVRSVEGPEGRVLAMPEEDYVLVTMIHSRRMKDLRIDSSEQRLVGRNPYADQFLDEQAREEAILSYGPVKRGSLPDHIRHPYPKTGFTLRDFMQENTRH